MRFDAEAAWEELQEKLLERDGWGTKQIVTEMAHLRAKHKIGEGLFERFLRLYGSRLAAAVNILPEAKSSPGGGSADRAEDDPRLTEDPKEDRDERSADTRAEVRRDRTPVPA